MKNLRKVSLQNATKHYQTPLVQLQRTKKNYLLLGHCYQEGG